MCTVWACGGEGPRAAARHLRHKRRGKCTCTIGTVFAALRQSYFDAGIPAGRRAIKHLEHLSAFAEQRAVGKVHEGHDVGPPLGLRHQFDAFDAPVCTQNRVHQHGCTTNNETNQYTACVAYTYHSPSLPEKLPQFVFGHRRVQVAHEYAQSPVLWRRRPLLGIQRCVDADSCWCRCCSHGPGLEPFLGLKPSSVVCGHRRVQVTHEYA